MTTFNLSNYEDKSKQSSPEQNASVDQADQKDTSDTNKIENSIDTSEIQITGSVSEIVAKSLYSIFPNVETISQEKHDGMIKLTTPKLSKDVLCIIALSKESIIESPVESLRLANTPGALLYIDTQSLPVNSKQESWFYLNVSNEQYFAIDSLVSKVKSLCIA